MLSKIASKNGIAYRILLFSINLIKMILTMGNSEEKKDI